ncbi:MAG: hypothetical protein WDO70_10625 [Alphaproteobacteria bacterium]
MSISARKTALLRLREKHIGLWTGVYFGGVMAVFSFLQSGEIIAPLVGGVITGALFGGCMSWLNSREKKRLKLKGFNVECTNPIQDREVLISDTQAIAFMTCKDAIGSLRKAQIISADASSGRIEARVSATWRSWGEKITIIVAPAENATNIKIRSAPILTTTMVDYGKGAENVETLLRAICKRIKEIA